MAGNVTPQSHNGMQTEATTENVTGDMLFCAYITVGKFEYILFSFIVPVIFSLITFIGVVGNTLVIHVILCKQKMRTVTNLLLLNLAFADLSFVIICPPFTAYSFATAEFPFGNVICKMMHYLLNVTAYVTVYTLVLISAMRYMTIVHNQETKHYRTPRNIVVMVCMIWSIMLILNLPIFLAYEVKGYCGVLECAISDPQTGKGLFGTFFAFAYVLPLTVIGLFSICILRHIRLRPSTLERGTRSEYRKKQASRLIILVVVIFAIFWLPIHIHLLLAWWDQLPLQNSVYESVSILWNVLAYFNSCVNPIIYNFASRDFRDSFHEAVCCCMPLQWRRQRADSLHTMTTKTPEERNGNVLATPAEKQVLVEMAGDKNHCIAAV